jgi:hypothetical protein
VNGASLPVGTYTAAQLQAQFPNQFPATWTQQSGSNINAASGSVQVLGDAGVELKLQHQLLSSGLKLTWPAGQLQESLTMATNSWTTLSVTSPHTNALTGTAKFFRLIQ